MSPFEKGLKAAEAGDLQVTPANGASVMDSTALRSRPTAAERGSSYGVARLGGSIKAL